MDMMPRREVIGRDRIFLYISIVNLKNPIVSLIILNYTILFITAVCMMQITSYLHHNTILIRETFSESLIKIRHNDVILQHVISFSIFMTSFTKVLTSAKKLMSR